MKTPLPCDEQNFEPSDECYGCEVGDACLLLMKKKEKADQILPEIMTHLNLAKDTLSRSYKADDCTSANIYSQQAIAAALIAIGEELNEAFQSYFWNRPS